MKVIRILLRFELFLVLPEPIGCDNDVSLPLGQRRRIILLTAASTAAPTLLALVILFAEGADFDEVHIRLNDVGGIPRIDGLAEIGDKVAGLQVELFEEE